MVARVILLEVLVGVEARFFFCTALIFCALHGYGRHLGAGTAVSEKKAKNGPDRGRFSPILPFLGQKWPPKGARELKLSLHIAFIAPDLP